MGGGMGAKGGGAAAGRSRGWMGSKSIATGARLRASDAARLASVRAAFLRLRESGESV